MASIAFTGLKATRVLLQPAKAASKSSASNSSSAGAVKAATKKKSGTERSKPKREGNDSEPANRNSTFLRLYPASPALSSFLGVSETCRPHAIKEVWAYAKLHNLQNSENKREILCDEKLKTLFAGKEKVGFSDVAKMISQHILKTA